jgi:hypothetical protein
VGGLTFTAELSVLVPPRRGDSGAPETPPFAAGRDYEDLAAVAAAAWH